MADRLETLLVLQGKVARLGMDDETGYLTDSSWKSQSAGNQHLRLKVYTHSSLCRFIE